LLADGGIKTAQSASTGTQALAGSKLLDRLLQDAREGEHKGFCEGYDVWVSKRYGGKEKGKSGRS